MTDSKPMKRPAVVEVEWIDSMGHSGWGRREARIEDLDRIDEMDHVSVGYLLKRNKQYVAVALSVGRIGNVGDTIQIPRVAIRRVTVLRKAT